MISKVKFSLNTHNANIFKSKAKQKMRFALEKTTNAEQIAQKHYLINDSGTLVLSNIPRLVKKFNKTVSQLKKEVTQFPKDFAYRKSLLKSLKLPESQAWKLRSIIGTKELGKLIKKNSKNPSIYNPGTIQHNELGKYVGFDNENVNNHTFGANLHMHTVYSDGRLTIKELLDKSAQYADERFKKHKQPFLFAITDHDAIAGGSEAIKIILKNPEKYKNIRLVLGCENSTIYKNDKYLNGPIWLHLLSYGINPNSMHMERFLSSRIKQYNSQINSAINNVNKTFETILDTNNIKYDFNEFAEGIPSIKNRLMFVHNHLKNYFQFKLIYATAVTNNKNLNSFLETKKIKLEDNDWIGAINYVPQRYNPSNFQQNWEYYAENLKKYIIDKVQKQESNISEDEILKLFTPISKEIRDTLIKLEEVLDPESKMSPGHAAFYKFEDAVSRLSKFDEGVMSIAHPSVYFPFKALTKSENLIKLYDNLYNKFVKLGGDKAKYAEDHYQIYYKDREIYLDDLKKLSEKYNLLKTGGLDTHSKDIFRGD